MSNPVEEAIKKHRILCKMGAAFFIGIALLLQSVYAAPSPTFRIQHKVSGYDLLQAHGGTRNDKRRIDAFSSKGHAEDKSFRWFFDPVLDINGAKTGYFYIHNLKTGLVLTQNVHEDYVENLTRVDQFNNDYIYPPQGQHWRLVDTFANDGSVMIINRYKLVGDIFNPDIVEHGLIQSHGGQDPDKHNVETKPGYLDPFNQIGFSWYLKPAGEVELSQLRIKELTCISPSTGIDDGTLALFSILGEVGAFAIGAAIPVGPWVGLALEIAAISAKAAGIDDPIEEKIESLLLELALNQSGADEILIGIGGMQIWPNEFGSGSRNMNSQETEPVNRTFIFEESVGAQVEIVEYDQGSSNDILNYKIFRLDGKQTRSTPDSKFFNPLEESAYTLNLSATTFRAVDPTRPLDVELVLEGEQGLASFGTIDVSPVPTNGVYPLGDTVTLTATPGYLAEFVRWEGVSNGVNLTNSCATTSPTTSTSSCVIVMAEDTRVKPVFKKMPRLIVDNIFAGNSVTFNPSGIPCTNVGYECQFYPTNSSVTISAISGRVDRVFDHWVGEANCLNGNDTSHHRMNVTVTDTMQCSPLFKRISYDLTVASDDLRVISDAASVIDCGAVCKDTYQVHAGEKTVLLTAQPKTGFTFVGWAGSSDCRDEDEDDSNKLTARVTVGAKDVQCNVIAYAAGTTFSLTVEKTGGGFIKAEALPVSDSSGIDCSLEVCSQNYPVTTEVQLTATATRGSVFAGFSTEQGSNTFTGDVTENICFDGQISMIEDVTCIASFNTSVLVIDGSNDSVPKESNEYIAAIQSVGGLDYDIWSVKHPTETSNPFGRTEPDAADLSKYGRVIWYSGNSNADIGPAAGPSLEAEGNLRRYLDSGGCFMLSSPEYFRDRAQTGLTDFAKNYLGVSQIIPDVTETHARSAGLSTLGFSKLASTIGVNPPNPFDFQNTSIGNKIDSVVHNPQVLGSSAIFKYRDGSGEAAVAVDNDTYRSVFMGFPFLGLNSGNDRNNVMKAFMSFCAQPERDDLFEVNDSFDQAVALKGLLSQQSLKRMPGNDDYFQWTANVFSNATFTIEFSHSVGDLEIEVYDSSQTLVGSSQSLRDSEDVFVSDVVVEDVYYIRVFGQNEVSVPYVLNISSDGDRDHDGVLDSEDGRPDDSDEQFDTDLDLIGNKADLDDDNDGMPDAYEILHGLDPLLATSASNDEDADGFTNLEEYTANTNPNDPNSFPVDTVPPVITPPVNMTVAALDATGVAATDSAIVAFLAAATASDNVDGSVSVTHDAGSQFALGSNTVIFSATDIAGNTGSETATVTVTDQSVPVITLVGQNSMTLNIDDTFTDEGATVSDNVDTNRTILGTGLVNTSSVGTYILTYSANDAAGNAAQSVTRSINVRGNTNDTVNDDTSNSGGGAINIWMLFILFSLKFVYVVSQRVRLKSDSVTPVRLDSVH